MAKAKQMEIGSAEWVHAWEQLLRTSVVVRSFLEWGGRYIKCRTYLWYMDESSNREASDVYHLMYEMDDRSLGAGVVRNELKPFAAGEHIRNEFHGGAFLYGLAALHPVPHQVQVHLGQYPSVLASNHPLVMPFHGMVCQHIDQQFLNTPSRSGHWRTCMQRFDAFFSQQIRKTRQDMMGEKIVRDE